MSLNLVTNYEIELDEGKSMMNWIVSEWTENRDENKRVDWTLAYRTCGC